MLCLTVAPDGIEQYYFVGVCQISICPQDVDTRARHSLASIVESLVSVFFRVKELTPRMLIRFLESPEPMSDISHAGADHSLVA